MPPLARHEILPLLSCLFRNRRTAFCTHVYDLELSLFMPHTVFRADDGRHYLFDAMRSKAFRIY